ncbi:MAG: septal ring lytic transglycosylase RlpA family protein [Hyphomicrobium sp.]
MTPRKPTFHPIASLVRAARRARVPLHAVLISAAALGACSGGSGFDSNLGVTASPRVADGRTIDKGGGVYKVGRPYRVSGRWYHPREDANYNRVGTASWYGTAFHGRRTSNGEIYNMYALTAGHPTLPMPSYAYVTNLQNGRTVLVRINDRGPYAKDRLIDLSYQTARELGYSNHGLARVRVRYAGRAPLSGDDGAERRYLAAQSWSGGRRAADDSTASITTGSVKKVRTVEYRQSLPPPPPPPSWSVDRYRRGELDSAKQAESILSKPAVDTYVRVGPFATREEAERLRYMLAGPDPSHIEATGSRDNPAYRLRLGPFDDADAASAMARIAGAGFEPDASPESAPGAAGSRR